MAEQTQQQYRPSETALGLRERLGVLSRQWDQGEPVGEDILREIDKAIDSEVSRRTEGLAEALANTLSLARLKWGNLDPDANKVFEQAEATLREARGE